MNTVISPSLLHPVGDPFLFGFMTAAMLLWSLLGRPWKVLLEPERQHATMGMIVLLALAWSIRARFPGFTAGAMAAGIPIQLLGATLAVVMFGLRAALMVLAGVALLSTWVLSGEAPLQWEAFVGRYMWFAAFPALLSSAVQFFIQRFLPRNVFIFIIGHGYLAAALAVFICGLSSASWIHAQTLFPVFQWIDVFAAVIVLAFAEGFLTGMLVAVFVVYRPHWVQTFSDDLYLSHPK
jgi:uncharacterized membrane protein